MLYIYFIVVALFLQPSISLDWNPLLQVLREGIVGRAFPGGVVAVGNSTHIIFQSPFGHLTYQKQDHEILVQNNTKYDVASITKIMATTLAVMNLKSSNSIKLDDPVSKYIQNYDTNKKSNTTIQNLLLHNAGLPFDYPGPLPQTQEDVIDYIRYLKPIHQIGTNFTYSNLGFLLLGKIVQKITNKTFNDYCSQNRIFANLKDTGFNPSFSEFHRIAPTQYDSQIRKKIVRGEAHQRLSYFFGGVAGHSGYFTTASDLLHYMRMLLNKGKNPQDLRVLPEQTISLFTRRVDNLPYNNTRGLGFDTNCPTQKMQNCFGHDGSTGIMAWVDTDKKLAFVVLTNRGHPNVNNNQFFTKYKKKISHTILQILGY